jgi:hypothetical protein
MLLRKLLALVLLNSFSNLFAQLPQTSLFLLHIDNPQDTSWTISKAEYLSAFNNGGYNNQPFFTSQSSLLASIRLRNGNNNDIYEFDLINKTFTNITHSRASEYSPRLSPNNSHNITCVSVPENDTSIQNLVEVNLDNGNYTNIIFNKFAKIGYYRFIKEKSWACYLVNEPHVLSICDAGLLNKKIFASSIGRSFEVINQKEILFVHKITSDHWILKSYNLITEKSRTIAEMPAGTEDFTLDENGNVICANDSKLLKLSKEGHWQLLIDLKPLKIGNINRIAMNKNLIALVSVTPS